MGVFKISVLLRHNQTNRGGVIVTQFDLLKNLLYDLHAMETSKPSVWITSETRQKVVEETKNKFQIWKQMLINTLEKLEFGDLTKK